MKVRPTCDNCALEDLKTGKCGNLLMNGEFKVNPKAKKLLMNTDLTGFCDYHKPKSGMESQVDYSFTEREVAVW